MSEISIMRLEDIPETGIPEGTIVVIGASTMADEIIIRGGINYSPFDIDEALCAIPGVKAAMAVGFENDFYGEEIGAYVQRAEGSPLTEAEILVTCRQRLSFAKSPKVVVFGDTFPVTSTGKYQRNKLKPLFAAWKSAEFRQ